MIKCPVCDSSECKYYCRKASIGHDCYRCLNCGFFFVFPHISTLAGDAASELEKEKISRDSSAYRAYRQWRIRETGLMAEMAMKGFTGGKLLDVGFGEYPINKIASRAGIDWFGLEPDQVSFQAALELYSLDPAKSFPLGVEQLDVSQPFATMRGTFDMILFFNALNYVSNPVGALNSFSRLLSSKGRLAISVADASGFWLTSRLRRCIGMDPWNYSILSFFNVMNLKMLFEKSGFRVVESKQMPILTPLSIEYLCRQNNSLILKLGLNFISKVGLERLFGLNTLLVILEKT